MYDCRRTVYGFLHAGAQRVSMIFRWVEGKPRCCHIHVSNPYEEMADEDEGFPMKMAKQTHDYLQQCIEQQKKQIAVAGDGAGEHI